MSLSSLVLVLDLDLISFSCTNPFARSWVPEAEEAVLRKPLLSGFASNLLGLRFWDETL